MSCQLFPRPRLVLALRLALVSTLATRLGNGGTNQNRHHTTMGAQANSPDPQVGAETKSEATQK